MIDILILIYVYIYAYYIITYIYIYNYASIQVSYRYLEVGSCHWSYWDLPCWHAQAVILHKAAFGAQLASGFHSHFAPAIYFKH